MDVVSWLRRVGILLLAALTAATMTATTGLGVDTAEAKQRCTVAKAGNATAKVCKGKKKATARAGGAKSESRQR